MNNSKLERCKKWCAVKSPSIEEMKRSLEAMKKVTQLKVGSKREDYQRAIGFLSAEIRLASTNANSTPTSNSNLVLPSSLPEQDKPITRLFGSDKEKAFNALKDLYG